MFFAFYNFNFSLNILQTFDVTECSGADAFGQSNNIRIVYGTIVRHCVADKVVFMTSTSNCIHYSTYTHPIIVAYNMIVYVLQPVRDQMYVDFKIVTTQVY
jgi:hypothetical protein